jgi:hypothetical protein
MNGFYVRMKWLSFELFRGKDTVAGTFGNTCPPF